MVLSFRNHPVRHSDSNRGAVQILLLCQNVPKIASRFSRLQLVSSGRRMSRTLTNFSRAEYSRLLDEFKSAGYRCIDFPTAAELTRHDEPHLILRHDIDFCVNAAREMALVEAEKGMFSTYF